MDDNDIFRDAAEADLDFLPTDWDAMARDQRDRRAATLRAGRRAQRAELDALAGPRDPHNPTAAS